MRLIREELLSTGIDIKDLKRSELRSMFGMVLIPGYLMEA